MRPFEHRHDNQLTQLPRSARGTTGCMFVRLSPAGSGAATFTHGPLVHVVGIADFDVRQLVLQLIGQPQSFLLPAPFLINAAELETRQSNAAEALVPRPQPLDQPRTDAQLLKDDRTQVVYVAVPDWVVIHVLGHDPQSDWAVRFLHPAIMARRGRLRSQRHSLLCGTAPSARLSPPAGQECCGRVRYSPIFARSDARICRGQQPLDHLIRCTLMPHGVSLRVG
jgi:hypothetical protein